ncbi:hypothetical protein ACGFZL_31130 [Streptomyces sp. NPDC048182]|uniref:hypothetical protein n=1 Tax=Streptomyces sp. NPDC048182 TaxID=3365507 RepID=UPI0037139B2C
MTPSKPLKYALVALAVYVAGVLYLRFGADPSRGWPGAMGLSLLCAPFVLLLGWVRERMLAKAQRLGQQYRDKNR